MKKVHLFLSLMVVILTYPLISLLIVLIIGNLVQNPTLWSHPITLLSLVIFILLFRKSIQFRQSFNIKISIKTIISIFILSISMYIVIGFIDFISKDISLIKKEFFTFPRLIYGLVLIPVLEEISCRIIIINKFKDKLNQWIIIIMTALYFGMLHAGSIYTVIGLSCFGFVLAYLYIKSGNGLLLILCHFFYNTINFCSYSIFWSVTSKASNYIYNPIHYIIVAISIMYIVYFFLKKKYV